MPDWNWNCDVTFCLDRQAFWVEWSESQNGYIGNFAGLYCNRHTSAIRAGWSPFEEFGTTPTVTLIRRAELHKILCEQAYIERSRS
jgi:hypothetical protein